MAAVAIGSVVVPRRWPLIALGAACAVVPDLDVVTLALGIPYQDIAGHRGLTHSVAFAAFLAAGVAWLVSRWGCAGVTPPRLALFLFLATVSHGLLDALTDGGLGVAFFAPFSDARYFFAWRPIAVSPISVRQFASSRGLRVLESELVVVWIPALLVFALSFLMPRRSAKPW